MMADPAYHREHYARNAHDYKRRARIRDKRMRPILRALIKRQKDRPCMDCGERYPSPVMEFDHVRGEKRFNIADAGSSGRSEAGVLREIRKCDVVCANCHRMRTVGRGIGGPRNPVVKPTAWEKGTLFYKEGEA